MRKLLLVGVALAIVFFSLFELRVSAVVTVERADSLFTQQAVSTKVQTWRIDWRW